VPCQPAQRGRLAREAKVREVGVGRAQVPHPDRVVEIEHERHTGGQQALGQSRTDERALAEHIHEIGVDARRGFQETARPRHGHAPRLAPELTRVAEDLAEGRVGER
jgi:hypothetical protein